MPRTDASPTSASRWARLASKFACLIVATLNEPLQASPLTDALSQARHADPQFLSAKANHAAASERSNQAFGALLPQLSFNANTSENRRRYETKGTDTPVAEDAYNSKSAQLSLNQNIWHRPSWFARTQADAALDQARHQVAAAEQDLIVRLAQAWFDVLAARDMTIFSSHQQEATGQQWEQVRRAVNNGLASGPMLEDARTKHDQAVAEHANAVAELQVKLAALEQIVGSTPAPPEVTLQPEFTPKDPRDKPLEQWLAEAEVANPGVLAARAALDAANEEVRKQGAGHEPTLAAVATHGRNSQGAGNFPGQNGYEITQTTVGLQLTIPLYSGGTQSAKVREALAMQEKASQDVEAARRIARQTVKQAWFAWQAAMARQTAALQAGRSTSVTLQMATKGKTSGVKTELDVLQARQQQANAMKDLQKARYEMITNHLKLRAAVGQLVDTDLASLDAWLIPAARADSPRATAEPQPGR